MAATGHLSLATARRPSLALIALCANLAVTLPLAYILNLWQDEAYTLQTTGHGLAYAFHQALAFEQNAPLYFVFLAALRHLGTSIFFLRLPSVLCIAVAVALVPELARRYIPAIDAGLVTLVAAWNPFVIWAAVEMRVYALIIVLSALLLLTFFDAFLVRTPSKASAFAYAVCCILALYTQYYLGFLIAAQALTLVLVHRRAIGRFA
ncbi:MAG: glycosyltransferase family 39 protein, partial [Candidatus Cybelea sp.]